MPLRDTVIIVYKVAASQAVAGMRKLVSGTKDAEQSSKELKGELSGLDKATDKVAASAGRMVAGFLGINTVRAAVTALIDDVEKLADSSRTTVDSLVDLMALDPANATANVAAATEFAKTAGRGIGETGDALFQFLSATGDLTRDQQQALFGEVTEATAISGPGTSTKEVADLFGTAQTISGEQDFQKLGNILRAGAVEGKLDTGKLARFLPRLLAPGQALGLELEETTGLFAAASRITGKPEEASTGLAAFMRTGLIDEGLREKFGISQNPLEAIAQLSARGGFDLEQAKELAGGEGAATLLSLVNRPKVLSTALGGVQRSARSSEDRDELEFKELMKNPLFRARFIDVRGEIEQEQAQLDAESLAGRGARNTIDAQLRNQGVGVFGRAIGREASKVVESFGGSAETQAIVQGFGSAALTAPISPSTTSLGRGTGAQMIVNGDVITNGGMKVSEPTPARDTDGGPGGDEGGRN